MLKNRGIASLAEVKIVRRGGYAIIKSKHRKFSKVHFKMGPELNQLTDQEILNRWNDYVASVELSAAVASVTRPEIYPRVGLSRDQGD